MNPISEEDDPHLFKIWNLKMEWWNQRWTWTSFNYSEHVMNCWCNVINICKLAPFLHLQNFVDICVSQKVVRIFIMTFKNICWQSWMKYRDWCNFAALLCIHQLWGPKTRGPLFLNLVCIFLISCQNNISLLDLHGNVHWAY